MKRVVVCAAALALGVTGAGFAQAGTPDGQGAQKRALVPSSGNGAGDCEPGGTSDGKGAGFVILNAAGKPDAPQKIVSTVSLKEGTPGTTYNVALAMDGTCAVLDTLTTNAEGNGNAHFELPFDVADEYWVVLSEGNQARFASAPVPLR